jgi:LacI family transcriptional regulator
MELGETAAQMLLRRIDGTSSGAVEQRIVAPSLVLRESTAAPFNPTNFSE